MLSLVNKIRSKLAYRRQVLRVMSELESCTDRELADMGIHRGDITNIARQVKPNTNLKGWV